MTTHHQIDLETGAVTKNAAIAQIGIVSMRVDEKRRAEIYDGCNIKIDVNCYASREFREEFDVSINTMLWWATQDSTTREAAFGKPDEKVPGRISLPLALHQLWMYMEQPNHSKKVKVWAKPPTFDLVILQHAFDVCDLPVPWHFREERCMRTMLDICAKDVSIHGAMLNNPEGGGRYRAKHDAYDDAEFQMEQLIGCLRQLGKVT